MPDLALVLEGDQCADRVLQRHLRVGPVELVERDLFELEPPQTTLAGLDQVLWPPVGRPLSRSGAHEAAFGRDHEIIRVRVERLADQFLAHVWPVGIGGVEKVHAELDRAAQHRLRLVAVGGLTPDAPTRDTHGAKAEAVDGQVAADINRAGHSGVPALRSDIDGDSL